MVTIPSSNTPVGSQAPAFTLPDTVSGSNISLSDYSSQPVLILFMCNHCPYVIHILDALITAARELDTMGIATVAISANDIQSHPADGPVKMAELARSRKFSFPYLYDETQQVAQAYHAECTPDLYLYDVHHHLYYRGQFDNTRPGGSPATGKDLLHAATCMIRGDSPPVNPPPSVGCSIKWKS